MQKGVSLAACTAPCRRQPCACQRCDRSPAFQPRSSGPRLHRGRAAAAAAAGGRFGSAGGLSSPSSEDAYAQELEAHLREAGQHDGEGPDPQHVRRLAAAAHWLAASADVAPHAALWLVVEHEHSMAACDLHASLAPKFELFRRLCAADPGSGTALAAALRSSPGGAALALPPAAFAAALHFTAAQLQRLSRGRYEQLHRPYSLLRFVQLHPDLAGGLLSQHPDGFERHAAPWLQQRLGWGEAALADAALSPCLPQLCQLDVRHAQRCLDWLLALGLTPPEAGRLLAADARLLAGPPAQLEAAAARVAELAEAWDVAPRLAAALALTQPWLTATMADRTAALLRALKDEVGMADAAVERFALDGGLDGGAFTRTDYGLRRATDRLKQLLLVCGGWPAVAAVLQAHPQALAASWQGVGGLLSEPAQRRAWQAVAAMRAAEQPEGAP